MKIININLRLGLLLLAILSQSIMSFDTNNNEQDHASQQFPSTPLHDLILNQNYTMAEKVAKIKELLRISTVNVNARNAQGRTALNLESMRNCDPQIIALLVASGADVNIPDLFNVTPLHNAIFKGSAQSAKVLLATGADAKFKNDQGMMPFDLARTGKTITLLKGLEVQ